MGRKKRVKEWIREEMSQTAWSFREISRETCLMYHRLISLYICDLLDQVMTALTWTDQTGLGSGIWYLESACYGSNFVLGPHVSVWNQSTCPEINLYSVNLGWIGWVWYMFSLIWNHLGRIFISDWWRYLCCITNWILLLIKQTEGCEPEPSKYQRR